MMSITHRQGCWPTPQQELLLRAILLQGREAAAAWAAWNAGVDIDHLDLGSHQLLPQLYHSLHAQGIDHPLMKKFKGVYRYTWYKNQMLFHQMAALLRALHEAGIKTMLLKGTALVLLYYKDYGLRPMEDFDILVPTAQASAAIGVLERLQWTPVKKLPNTLTESYTSAIHAHGFRDAEGRECDLHWHALLDCCQPDADEEFWSGAVVPHLQDVPVSALNPTDQLLHVCVHGARWSAVPPFRWVVDAMVILKQSPEIDWHRLVTQAQKRRLILPVRDMLQYMQRTLNAQVPLSVLHTLQDLPVSNAERIEYEAKTYPEDLRNHRLILRFRYQQYVESMSRTGLQHRLLGFPRFLQHLWDVDHLWQVPFYATVKGMQRVWRRWRVKA